MTDDVQEESAGGLPATGTGERARRRAARQHQRRVQEAWFTVAVVVLASAIPILGYVGFHKVYTTTAGRRIDAQNDPTKPNYEANVVPTPVLLLGQKDAERGLTSLTMLSLGGGDVGGGVVFIPVHSVVPALTDTSTTTSTSTSKSSSSSTSRSSSSSTSSTSPSGRSLTTTLAAAYASKGDADLEQLAANTVGLSFDQTTILSDDALAQFIAPAAPLRVDNPDRIVELDAKGRVTEAFPAGPLTLDAADVARYLKLRNPTESDLARLARQQLVWQAWLAAIKASTNPNIVPGESTSGLGRYVRALAKGDVRFSTLPGAVTTDPTTGDEEFRPDTTAIADLMESLVPLPAPANPGDRVRVRILSGVGPVDVTALVGAHLVPPNAQITIVGNADRFDHATTSISYYDDAFASAAADVQRLYGVGDVVKSATSVDTEDVTIIVGRDLVDKRGLKITQGSTGG